MSQFISIQYRRSLTIVVSSLLFILSFHVSAYAMGWQKKDNVKKYDKYEVSDQKMSEFADLFFELSSLVPESLVEYNDLDENTIEQIEVIEEKIKGLLPNFDTRLYFGGLVEKERLTKKLMDIFDSQATVFGVDIASVSAIPLTVMYFVTFNYFLTGSLMEWFDINDGNFFHDLHDCLLYTSPSPRDKRQSRMPSSA